MESRVNKYNNDDKSTTTVAPLSRTKKNANLYNEINELQMDTFDVDSNSMILGNNGNIIDIDKLRDMLDKKYREESKNKSLSKLEHNYPDEEINLDETREFDINEILNKAKQDKQDDYEVERLKKLKNTQVDILSELNIESLKEGEKSKAVSEEEGDKLKDLIDTINLTEETNKIKNMKLDEIDDENAEDMDPLDLLSDLKGDEDETKVEGVGELTSEIMKAAQKEVEKEQQEYDDRLSTDTTKIDNLQEELKGIIEKDNKKKEKLENSFYTTSSMITQTDFEDFSDLKDDITATKVIVRILVIVVVLAFICGVVFLLNRILDWGLF